VPVGRAQARLAERADQVEQAREAVDGGVLVHERDVGRKAGEVAAAREHLVVRGRQHDAAHRVVVARALEGGDQLVDQLVGERVARLGLVERDGRDAIRDVVAQRGEGHPAAQPSRTQILACARPAFSACATE
jgi:hypothetical protein